MSEGGRDPETRKDRRVIRLILVMVAAGWLAALALMAVAAVFWDKS